MKLKYWSRVAGIVALGTAVVACGGGTTGKCDAGCAADALHPTDRTPNEDAAADRAVDARGTDASPSDAPDATGGLPCPQSPSLLSACEQGPVGSECFFTWDALSSDPDYCETRRLVVTGTCGDYRVVEDDSNGDEVFFYDYDDSGALVAIVTLSENQYRCEAGLVATVPPPCLYLNSPGATKVCPTDAGPD